MKKNIRILTTFIIFFITIQFNISYASGSNFLNVDITKKNNDLVIKEEWNVVLKDTNVFEREFNLDKNSISNIQAQQIFPKNKCLEFSTDYKTINNRTNINIPVDSKYGESVILKLEYNLNIDKKTETNFIENIPYSLSSINSYGINMIKLNLDVDGYSYNGNVTFGENKEFSQITSKSKTLEVFIQLLKLGINIISVIAVCGCLYAILITLYYKKNSRLHNKNPLKKIKNKKRTIHYKKKNLSLKSKNTPSSA